MGRTGSDVRFDDGDQVLADIQAFFQRELADSDPLVSKALRLEDIRQRTQLELMAPKNYTSWAARQAFASIISFTSGEGFPGRRYHAGMSNLDVIEEAAITRAKQLFSCRYANVQPHSGTQANQTVYFATLRPGDRVLSMSLRSGGHLSHGLRSNLSGRWFETEHYDVREDDGLIDYDQVDELCERFRPRLVIAGGSSYPRAIDFARFRAAADRVGAYLLADIAHISGLVAVGLHPSPLPFAHFVTTSTNKNLRGPRGGLVLSDDETVSAERLDAALFPGVQGGLLPEYVAAKAVCFAEGLRPEFTEYASAVLENARTLAAVLTERGYEVVTGGTDTPLVVIDLRSVGLTGNVAADALERVGLPCNRNLVPKDPQGPDITSGLRFGTSAVTTRGLRSAEMRVVGTWLADVLDALRVGSSRLAEVTKRIGTEVVELATAFPIYPEPVALTKYQAL